MSGVTEQELQAGKKVSKCGRKSKEVTRCCAVYFGTKTCEKVEEGGIVKYEEVRNGKEVLEGGAEHEQRQDSGTVFMWA